MKREKQIAIEAARRAGQLQREKLGKISTVDYKSAFNIVTDVDKASEELILTTLRSEFSDDAVLAEESGASAGKHGRRWLIDPLDGTTNYTHSYPFFAVSIGLETDGEVVLGIVYNPVSDELFYAEKGEGAWLNDEKIHVSVTGRLSESLLTTGFPPDTRNTGSDNMTEFKTLTNMSHGVRRDGSAALDLCFVACGRTDGFWEMKLAPWDLAAGSLMITEAGGTVTNLEGENLDLSKGHILATNGKIHQDIIKVLSDLKIRS